MESNQLGLALQDSFESLKSYIDHQVKYNKLVLTQKLGDITSYFALLFIVSALAGGLLLFLSFAFAYWFANITNLDVYVGYLIVALFYGLLITLVIRYREKLLFQPVRNLLGTILFEGEMGAESNPFSSKEDLKQKISDTHTLIQNEQEEIRRKFHLLGESITITNITQQVFRSAYNSFATSSNIARLAFLLVKRFKRKPKNNEHKKST